MRTIHSTFFSLNTSKNISTTNDYSHFNTSVYD